MAGPRRLGGVLLVTAGLLLAAGNASAQSASQAGCAWPLKADYQSLNLLWPDESANYWLARFTSVPGSRLVIRGHYPFARYTSLQVYDEAARVVDALADFELDPDPGSHNPFRGAPGTGSDRRYTAYVEFGAKPEQRASNTLYAGRTPEGAPNPMGFIFYRVYVPDDPASAQGGVPLPDITLESADGSLKVPLAQCDSANPPAGGPVNDAERNATFPDGTRAPKVPQAQNPPIWRRYPTTGAGVYSNEHNAYVFSLLSREYGDVVVFRAKAPTFPDTRAGEPVTAASQVRYWSFCQNEFFLLRGVDCLADFETVADRDGYLTFVVSDPGHRPANATRDHGVNWLPWGPSYEAFLVYRHMLPAPSFSEAAQNVPGNAIADGVMGDYYPRIAYCDRAVFEAQGWRGCGLPAVQGTNGTRRDPVRPRLKLRLHYSAGRATTGRRCARGRIRALLVGQDRRLVSRADFYIGRRRFARDHRAPFRASVALNMLRGGRRHQLRVQVRLTDGSRWSLTRRIAACRA